MVGAFQKPSSGREPKPIHSIPYSVAQPLDRGYKNYYSIIQGNRQGFLSRSITRRSGRIAKACCKKWFCNSESSLSKKPEGTFLTSCCAGRDASLPAQTIVIMAAAPGFAIARALCARGALSAKREEVPLGCNLGKALPIWNSCR